jgi:hypothetical protein
MRVISGRVDSRPRGAKDLFRFIVTQCRNALAEAPTVPDQAPRISRTGFLARGKAQNGGTSAIFAPVSRARSI